jgi:hypothetical protein
MYISPRNCYGDENGGMILRTEHEYQLRTYCCPLHEREKSLGAIIFSAELKLLLLAG